MAEVGEGPQEFTVTLPAGTTPKRDLPNKIQPKIQRRPSPTSTIAEEVLPPTPTEPIVNEKEIFADLDALRKELNATYNRPWKINPSDVADFYVQELFIFRPPEHYPSSSEQLRLLRARAHLEEIGYRTCYANLRAALIEGLIYSTLRPKDYFNPPPDRSSLIKEIDPATLRRVIPRYLDAAIYWLASEQAKPGDGDGKDIQKLQTRLSDLVSYRQQFLGAKTDDAILARPDIVVAALRYQLFTWRERVRTYENGNAPAPLFADRQGLWDTLDIVEKTIISDQWKQITRYLKAYFFADYSREDIIPGDLEKAKRKTFVIDRFFNIAHATGSMMEKIANDFPGMTLTLALHGIRHNPLPALWPRTSPTAMDDLTTRSRLLLGEFKPPVKDELSPEQREDLMESVSRLDDVGSLCGIALGCPDPQVRRLAIEKATPILVNLNRDRDLGFFDNIRRELKIIFHGNNLIERIGVKDLYLPPDIGESED